MLCNARGVSFVFVYRVYLSSCGVCSICLVLVNQMYLHNFLKILLIEFTFDVKNKLLSQ